MIKEIIAKSVLHYHKRNFASHWDLNIYRGCEHKCVYCFAQYSHKYLNNTLESKFFDDIFVKINIADILDKELSKKSWKGEIIQISGVTDCYQPIEEKYQLMRNVLNVLIKHKQNVSILTKSTLIRRDLDLISSLSKVAKVYLGTTITTLNENIRKKIEPNTVSSMERLNMMKTFENVSCFKSILFAPIIPYLTDNTKDIENLYKIASEYNINNIIPSVLNMRGDLKHNFYNFLKENYHFTYTKIQHLYKGAYSSKEYNEKLYKFLYKMKKKYSFNCKNCFLQSEFVNKQLDLFEVN